MKKILSILVALLIALPVYADTCGSSLTGLFTSFQAVKLCKVFGSAVNHSLIPDTDNTYDLGSASLGWRTAYVDTSVITPLVSHASSLALGIAGTAEATVTNDTLTFSGAAASIVGGATSLTVGSAGSTILKADADANRIATYDWASDTAGTFKWGDGTTAAQTFAIASADADASDDSEGHFTAGGAIASDGSRGAIVSAYGNEHATGAGKLELIAGNAAGDGRIQIITKAASAINFLTGNSQRLGISGTGVSTFTGTVLSTATSDIGWSVVAGANTACNTTCTNACVVGQDSGTSNIFVGCADATADVCLCAGAS